MAYITQTTLSVDDTHAVDERGSHCVVSQGQPCAGLDRGMGYLHADALLDDRIGAGHPEGLFEAWSNLYYRFALAMDAGFEGGRWIERCVESADNDAAWVAC